MITVIPIKDKEKIKKFYNEFNQPISENSGVTVARNGEEFLGCCLYDIDAEKIIINFLVPQNDIMLADGILRSALHIADYRGIVNAFYQDGDLTGILKKLDFIENEQEKTLKIQKLHESTCSCQKK